MVWAHWLGVKAAERIIGGDAPVDTVFADYEFQTRPFYHGTPWFLPGVIAWYGLKDRLGL